MTNPKFWHDHEFNADATFIVAGWLPGFTHKGIVPQKGKVFDKAGVRPDRLRALYEQRWIRMAEPGEELAYQNSPLPNADEMQAEADKADKPRRKKQAGQ